MTRLLTLGPAVMMACVGAVAPAGAQIVPAVQPIARVTVAAQADLHGRVVDDRGDPLTGAVVSALGSTTLFAISDRDGRFAFRDLRPGPYLVRAHLQGYVPAPGRIIQVTGQARALWTIALTRRDQGDEPQVLAAGVGAIGEPSRVQARPDDAAEHDHGEVAWRLRHLRRSVLKDSESTLVGLDDQGSFFEDSLAGLGRAIGTPARLATALLSDLPLTGQINLLTSTSFDHPQGLFSSNGLSPHGVAYFSVAAPAAAGQWDMRGAMTEGDLSSWILAGSYVRAVEAEHRYEAGLSYSMQRYQGGNADALAAMTDGSRNASSVSVHDHWTINPHVSVGYGAKYARYDYLSARGLVSPRVAVSVKPRADDSLALRAAVSRREIAPGAEEFLPPSTGLWLPPERTFSPVSPRRGFTPERILHMEVAAERRWAGDVVVGLRAFSQRVDDQLVTLFGAARPGKMPASLGHYYVASGGDFEARGWGASISRAVVDGVQASIDYTQTDAEWVGASPDGGALAMRGGVERMHDLTTSLATVVPVTATQVFVVYRLNTAFVGADAASASPGARFDLRVNQALPFMTFTNAQWEMLVAVRNLFRDDLLDSSVYDELLVVRPPTRVVGGVTVKF